MSGEYPIGDFDTWLEENLKDPKFVGEWIAAQVRREETETEEQHKSFLFGALQRLAAIHGIHIRRYEVDDE